MANTMDTILVKCGNNRTISILQFLYPDKHPLNPPLKLTDVEKKIQEATCLVYKLNGKEPPLYKRFNNRDLQKPLTINCHSKISSGLEAYYDDTENEISFVNSNGNLVESLAHELKHAEQHADPELQQIFDGEDNKAKGNVLLIDEAEAVWAGTKAGIETGQDESEDYYYDKLYRQLLREYTDEKGNPDFPKIKEKMMTSFIEDVSKRRMGLGYYLGQVEAQYPENFCDKGLESVPAHYGLTEDFLKIVKGIPIHFCVENRIEIMKKIPDEMAKLKESGAEGEKQFIKKLISRMSSMKTTKNLQAFFDVMKDEKGRLPFSREVFEDQDKCNLLLERFASELDGIAEFRYQYERLLRAHDENLMRALACAVNSEYCYGAIPILMSLKDKDGKPIISQENIDKFSEKSLLAKDVKVFAKKDATLKGQLARISKQSSPSSEKVKKAFIAKRAKDKRQVCG